ncbi:MAG TPA: flagellar basal body P-ring formation chaperone FlgA [Xanthomonadaceae bacterium]|nr:flagellar basal body P-ring formation chaperone FlgA [Xanthomonadaceae bacterium]
MRSIVLLPLLASLLAAPAARAVDAQPLEAIRLAAYQALGADPARAEATLSPGLHLTACAQPLQAVASGPRTALVRCADAPGWKLYVPVAAHREGDVVVLRTPAAAGVPLSADQLVVQRRTLPDDGQAPASDPAALVGQVPVRALAPGAIPAATDFSAGPPLQRGDPVVLLTRIGGIEVRMAGRALGTTRQGGLVSAENVDSHRVVRGRLSAPGVVELLQ